MSGSSQPNTTNVKGPSQTASAASSTRGNRHKQRQKKQRFVQIGNIALSVIKGDIIQQTV